MEWLRHRYSGDSGRVRAVGASLLALALAACGPTGQSSGDGDGTTDGGTDPGDGECQGANCLNLCPGGTRTTITGRVLAPNGIDPVPGALVYVPTTVADFPSEVTCEVCSSITGGAVVSTTTAVDGTFTLGPIPTAENQAPGTAVDLVAQKGRFRKVSQVVINSPCADNAAPDGLTTLPSRTQGQDTVPNIAVVTGSYDMMECVLLNMGMAADSFSLYNGIDDPWLGGSPGTLGDADVLLRDLGVLKTYNVVFMNCSNNDFEGLLSDESIRNNIESYVLSGGRLYVTDWSYDYIEQIEEFSPMIDFGPGQSDNAPEPPNDAAKGRGGITTEAMVHDDDLADWLGAVETITGEEIISDDRRVHIEHFLTNWAMQYQVAMLDDVKMWLSGSVDGTGLEGDLPLTTTFDYQSCGRVLYSSYHTRGRDVGMPDMEFPNYCPETGLSPQERVLMYLVMHVADCISID